MRKIDFRLSLYQLGSIFSLVILIIASIKFFHHQTDDYSVPFFSYLGTFRLAIPPVAALFASYLLVFIAGVKISDAPHLIITYLRNQFFQSKAMMFYSICTLLFIAALIFWYTENTVPPSYERIVSIILGGEQDRQVLLTKEFKLLKTKNQDLERQFRFVSEVFLERSERNFNHEKQNTTIPRIFVRALSQNLKTTNWKKHPLRKLALAEAYSMWAQASRNSPLREPKDFSWKRLLRKSQELNEEVASSNSPLATSLMKNSALNNSGNSALYAGDYTSAKEFYERVLKDKLNLSTAGNLIAIYVLLDDLDSAISYGNKIQEWAMVTGKALTEPSSYSSVLVNAASAFLIKREYQKSSELLMQAYDLESDNLNAATLAISFVLEGDNNRARYVLSQFRYPELDLEYQRKRVTEKYDSCYYLIRGLLFNNLEYSFISAHLNLYLGRARTKEQLLKENDMSINSLKSSVRQALKHDRTPCRDFYLIPGVRELLGEK